MAQAQVVGTGNAETRVLEARAFNSRAGRETTAHDAAGGARRAWAGLCLVVLALVVSLGLGGCRTSAPPANGTALASGDTLHGRMVAGRIEQAFTFEGVESSLVDFTIRADRGNQSAPRVEVLDPEGRSLDVLGSMTTSTTSATVKVKSLVLTKTGTYKVIARPSAPLDSTCESAYYRFNHCLRFAPIADQRAHLSVDKPRPIYISAPRGGFIVCRIEPGRCSDLEPDILGVKDPWGGPALERSLVPQGANPPRVSHAQNRAMILTFTAARPGMYTILCAAKPCKAGVGTIHVEVRQPKGCRRSVYHGGAPAGDFGVPGARAPDQKPTACPPPAPPPCPPPPVCEPVVAPPETSPDRGIASR